MNAVLRWMRTRSAGRIFFAGLAMMAGLLFAVPGAAQETRPGAADSVQGTTLPANIPVQREQPSNGNSPANDLGWIAIVLAMGLIAIAVLVARRRSRSPMAPRASTGAWWRRLGGLLDAVPSHEIQRVSSMPLSPHHSLHVVVWNGRRLLLGCSDQSIQLLAETPSSPDRPRQEASMKEAQQ
ncbi:FliO/MopB family protein (plasmid) [Variovorax sp. PDNC026]|uniref:flagellar biosynthetic protein FliO n=1 Tax=Variovorax sp. PDNC026 TaxID=2811425 RepID=UPI001962A696|nr:flagellar biosynthetic protein FliO [Variovorax sp. PDNC026]QRY35500.1 FliO/MopB family protein [Variovorax sp. PDNC026]